MGTSVWPQKVPEPQSFTSPTWAGLCQVFAISPSAQLYAKELLSRAAALTTSEISFPVRRSIKKGRLCSFLDCGFRVGTNPKDDSGGFYLAENTVVYPGPWSHTLLVTILWPKGVDARSRGCNCTREPRESP